MSGSIGHTYVYNIIILFIVIVFAFLAGTLSYYKAFKINNKIVDSLEKYEGYNKLAKPEIEKSLGTIGYQTKTKNCPTEYKKMILVKMDSDEIYSYCIYIDNISPKAGTYYQYGVLTYMNIDLPVIKNLSIPVFTKTNRIYKFSN